MTDEKLKQRAREWLLEHDYDRDATEILLDDFVAFASSIQEEARQQIEKLTAERDFAVEQVKCCCGDAHLELKAIDAHLMDMGIHTKRVHKDGIVEITWQNQRAEAAEQQLTEARAQGMKEVATCPECGSTDLTLFDKGGETFIHCSDDQKHLCWVVETAQDFRRFFEQASPVSLAGIEG